MYAVIPVLVMDGGEVSVSDQTLGYIWKVMEAEEKTKTVFYNGTIKTAPDFISYMRRADVYPVVVFDVTKQDYCGVAWVNNLNEGSGQAHFCTFNSGDPREMGKEVLNYWRQFGEWLRVLVGIIPASNGKAVAFAKKIGFVEIGSIPQYCNTVYREARTNGVVLYYLLGGN